MDGKWIITEGVKAGDKVITSGLQKVIPGKPVRIIQNVTEEQTPVKKQNILNTVIEKIKSFIK